MPKTVFDVATYFLHKNDFDAGSAITPLKLQKLVYYAQAWSVTLLGQPLFDDAFEAWVHGPVNPDLFRRYAGYGFQVIDEVPEASFDIFDEDEVALLDEVWEVYGKYDAKYLEDLTHQEPPWLNARGDLPPDARSNQIITIESMKEYYSSLLDANGETQ